MCGLEYFLPTNVFLCASSIEPVVQIIIRPWKFWDTWKMLEDTNAETMEVIMEIRMRS